MAKPLELAGFWWSGLVCLVLAVLKLTVEAQWSWWRVWLPLWAVLGHNILNIIVGFVGFISPMTVESSDDKDAGLPVVPDRTQPGPQQPIRRCQFRSLDGALHNAQWMAESEDLELKRRTAPEGNEKRGQESGQ